MHTMPDKNDPRLSANNTDDKTSENHSKASESDPQLTELDGLKKGGVEPNVTEEDKYIDKDGKKDE